MKKIIFLYILFLSSGVFSHNTDSLKLSLKRATNDTARCRILDVLINSLNDTDVYWPKYNLQLKGICEKNLAINKSISPLHNFYSKYLARSLFNIAYNYDVNEEYPEALLYYRKCLAIREELKDEKEMSYCNFSLGFVYHLSFNYDSALIYYEKSFVLAKRINDQAGIVEVAKNLSDVYVRKGNMMKALEFYQVGYEASIKTNNKKEAAKTLYDIGSLYKSWGDIPKALEYQHKALKAFEEVGYKRGVASSLGAIGLVYQSQRDYPNALLYFERSLKTYTEAKDKDGIGYTYNSLGAYYGDTKNYDKALEYYQKSLDLRIETKNQRGIARAYHNIAQVYKNTNKYELALSYFEKALEISETEKSQREICTYLNSLADLFLADNKYNEAKLKSERAFKLASQLGFPDEIRLAAKTLSKVYAASKNYKGAYEMHLLYKQMSDSITSETNRKASIQKSFQYEYDKKVAADSIKMMDEKKVEQAKLTASEAKLKQEKTQRFALYGGLILLLVFAGFMFNRFRIIQKQKNIIEVKEKETQHQKQIIEEKHKEITDSINYAERIQRSFLATNEQLDKNLKEYFIFFKPKDIVSGDFYWATELQNNNFAFAVADSTGHGVPGAIMSLLNITSLEKASERSNEPAEILNLTRNAIIKRLKKDGSKEGGKDGMDCSLMVFDLENKQLKIAAAHNPVFMIRNNELIQIVADKMPVGKHDKDSVSFIQHSHDLRKGDMIYALTDGFPDQFGGPNGKKFMSKNLKTLLLTNNQLPVSEQKQILESTFKNWVGDLEQVDDVCVIGIRV